METQLLVLADTALSPTGRAAVLPQPVPACILFADTASAKEQIHSSRRGTYSKSLHPFCSKKA